MSMRMQLTVGDDTPELMSQLAGGERQRGAWLEDLVRRLASGELVIVDAWRQQHDRREQQAFTQQLRAIEAQVHLLKAQIAQTKAGFTRLDELERTGRIYRPKLERGK